MSTSIRHRTITFLPYDSDGTPLDIQFRIPLTLSGPWKLAAGIKPDVNSGKVSYRDRDKLQIAAYPGLGKAARKMLVGQIEFWYRLSPDQSFDVGAGDATPAVADFMIEQVRMFASQPLRYGTPIGETDPRVLEYELHFADSRFDFVDPRGGRLFLGVLNAGPKLPGAPDDQSSDFAEDDPDSESAEYSLADLIGVCMDAMGLEGDVPDIDPAIDAPRDIKWFGAHAPSELAKLLDLAGCVLVPALDGSCSLEKIRSKGEVNFSSDGRLADQILPSLDLRGSIVIFSSFPAVAIQTQTTGTKDKDDDGNDAPSWEFVIQDSKDAWKPLDDCDLIPNGDIAGTFTNNGLRIPEKQRQRATRQIFQFIRLKKSVADPALSPILERRVETDGDHDLQVLARRVVADAASGQYKNSDAELQITVLELLAGNILHLDAPLYLVKNPTSNPGKDYDKPSDFTVRYSVVAVEDDPFNEGQKRPRYFHAGYTLTDGTVTSVDDQTIEAALAGNPSDVTHIYARPQYRLLKVDGEDTNIDAIKAAARAEAARYFLGAADPVKLIQARGFASLPPSGLVSEVEWDQESLITRAKVNDWFTLDGEIRRSGAIEGGDEAAASRGGGAGGAEVSATLLGQPGSTPAVVPLNPLSAPAGVGGIPPPSARYQVYTPIDDTLSPIWTSARFM